MMIGSDFESWESFAEYAKIHYLPLIYELAENNFSNMELSPEQRNKLYFLHDDLTSIVNNAEVLDERMNIKRGCDITKFIQ